MPGSPPSSSREPLTSPPPSTRSSSEIPVRYRMSSWEWISPMWETAAGFPPPREPDTAGEAAMGVTCSKVFHAEQAGHFPIHFTVSYPHSLHTYRSFALAIAHSCPFPSSLIFYSAYLVLNLLIVL